MERRTDWRKFNAILKNSNKIAAIELGLFGKTCKEIARNLDIYEKQFESNFEEELRDLETHFKRNSP